MSCYPQKPKSWTMEPYLNYSWNDLIGISPNLIKISVSYRFMMGSLSWLGGSTLLKANLDKCEEVHQAVKNFNPTQGYLRHQLVWHTRWENIIKKIPQVGVAQRSSFLSKGLRLPKKLDLQRTPLAKSVAMLIAMSFFHPCLKFSTGEVVAIL